MLLSNRLFFEQVEAMLDEGCEVEMRMKGHSMRPLLRNERDRAVLAPCPDPQTLRRGDVVLFRCGGRHILHRIVQVDFLLGTTAAIPAETFGAEARLPYGTPPTGNRPTDMQTARDREQTTEMHAAGHGKQLFTLAGDGNYRQREQCRREDIVAVLVRVVRPSGRVVDCRSRRWRWQSRLWLAAPLLLRRIVLGILRHFGIG